MKHFLLALPLLLAACGAKANDLTLSVSGVTMADVEKIRGDLSGLKGAADVKAGQFKDGQVSFTLKYEGKGSELASKLAGLGSGLKNVKGFDDASVQVSYDGAAPVATPAPVNPTAAVSPTKPADPGPAPQPKKPDPGFWPDDKKETDRKEIKVDVKKDPLAYKVHQLPGGTIATFDGWKIVPLPGDSNWAKMETHPDGKEEDFQMIVAAGTPGPQAMANIFEEGRAYLQQNIQGIQANGEPQKTLIGGDDAHVQDWTFQYKGNPVKVQSIIIRKKDVAVIVLAFGSDAGWKEYGRAPGITAQSITVKSDPPDPALVGTWLLEKYYSSGAGTSNQFSHSSSTSMTIYPNGTFTETSSSASNLNNNTGNTSAYVDGGNRGKVVKRGTTLSFTYDNGKVWNAEFKLDGGALVLNGNYWMRQR